MSDPQPEQGGRDKCLHVGGAPGLAAEQRLDAIHLPRDGDRKRVVDLLADPGDDALEAGIVVLFVQEVMVLDVVHEGNSIRKDGSFLRTKPTSTRSWLSRFSIRTTFLKRRPVLSRFALPLAWCCSGNCHPAPVRSEGRPPSTHGAPVRWRGGCLGQG